MIKVATFACVVTLLLGACGKKADPGAGPASGSAVATAPADPAKADPSKPDPGKPAPGKAVCSYLTEAEASQLLGAPAKHVENTVNPEESCEVTTTTDAKAGITVSIKLTRDPAEYDFAVANPGPKDAKPEPIANLGDKATWLQSEVLSRLYVAKNGQILYLHVVDDFGKPASKDLAIALAQKVAARM